MAETIKCVLFVDYDSIYRSLMASDPLAAERLAPRVDAWVSAIEAGHLFATKADGAARRRILVRRCYADPTLLGDNRLSFLSCGFQVIDCPPAEGHDRNSAAIDIVLDTIDALEHPAAYEEFILLSAETDLSSVLIRLRANNRLTAIYANAADTETYKAIADSMIDELRLMSTLLSEDEPAASDQTATAIPQADPSEVEVLARKISSATNVPLFAPRTFAELFRSLVDEIAENGYNFQTTAENVASRMADAGRDVSRRQVVFVVKGLALKGHVFSTSDTPERLAEVFRVQVVYLAENSGLELSEDERSLLSSWIVGQAPPASSDSTSDAETMLDSAVSTNSAAETPKAPTAKSPSAKTGRSPKKKPSASGTSSKPGSASAAQSNAPSQAPRPATKVSTPAAQPPKGPETDVAKTAQEIDPAKSPSGSSPNGASSAKPQSKPAVRPSALDEEEAAVESSILAAIAQAVDVLVDDGNEKPKDSTNSGQPTEAPEESNPPPSPGNDADVSSDEIGDEIQRIIASYGRNRKRESSS